ncbi:MAG: hypothetical protein QOC63_2888 [Mycobacterium sp.]|nr:hypothetical protein [Mycobacterium sp.]
MGEARPPLPLMFVAVLAKLLPGWTNIGQMDCPICAMAELTGPLLPIPTVFSTGEIKSPTPSACAGVAHVTAAMTIPTDTTTGRNTTTDAAMMSTVPSWVRPVLGLACRLDIGRL